MINQYPVWKYVFIGAVIFACALYALPNLFGDDPSVQISPGFASNLQVDESVRTRTLNVLKDIGIEPASVELLEKQLLLRFADIETQLKAYSELEGSSELSGYTVAQNLAAATPDWLTSLGGRPMYLGLDLRGGVHFLMEVDMKTAIRQNEERYVQDFRSLLRKEKLRYKSVSRLVRGGVQVMFTDEAVRDKGRGVILRDNSELESIDINTANGFGLYFTYTKAALKEAKQQAIEQNITTLRKRVNALGVAEPIIQRQGDERIVVQLPGVQDTARAKEILQATATLEFRLTEGQTDDKWHEAEQSGRVPPNARLYHHRDGRPVLLKRQVITTGDQITQAASTIDQREGRPIVTVRLDGKGAKRMLDNTRKNLYKLMAVVFIQHKQETKEMDGKPVKIRRKVEEIISLATIQGEFGKNFQISGLTSQEAKNLALLLNAGALKAPIEIVEERTIGPSLGRESIEQGRNAIVLGFALVLIFMAVRYSRFGLVADFVLLLNLVILVALLSLLQATLTLPGIAGIVLTIGMAVDANVLIFERIREEVKNGNSPQASIHAGYAKAFGTIADSNVTTLIAGIVLFGFGTGPIKGFAVTLSLGIATSMFTAIMVSRAVVNYVYGGRKIAKLPL